MSRYHRIIWSEGLFLTPHHLQQAELYQEGRLNEAVALTSAFPWGARSMEIDTENLARGTFRLLSFRGLLRGGTQVRLPEIDPVPPSLDFREIFDLRAEHLDVHLGIPLRRSGWPNCVLPGQSAEGSGETRFRAQSVTVEDENTGRNERLIQKSELSLRLLAGPETRDAFETLQIARVVRTSAGTYQLAEEYIPPVLALAGSPVLGRICRSLLERLSARSSELSSRFTEAGADSRDITPANLRAFLQFSVVNGTIPLLAHYRNAEGTHPEALYQALAGLAGELSTFNPRKLHPRDIPAYDHEGLGPVFTTLERVLADLLELQVSQGYVVIPLTRVGEGRWSGSIQKDSLLSASSALFLSVASEVIGEREIMSGASRIIVAAPDRVEQKINMNLPGLALHFTAIPPPAIPRRRGTWYFQLDNRSADWEAIRAARGLALDIPPEFRTADLELLALEGNS